MQNNENKFFNLWLPFIESSAISNSLSKRNLHLRLIMSNANSLMAAEERGEYF